MKTVLIIGAGFFIDTNREHYGKAKITRLDKIILPNIDVVHDLEIFPYPFFDSQFDEIVAEHVLEHLDKLVEVMSELWRITKKDGIIKIIVPAWTAWQAYTDPMHKRFFTRESFDFWDSNTPLGRERGYYISQNVKFKIEKKIIGFFNYPFPYIFQFIFNKFYNFYKKYLLWIFPANDIYFELRVLKDETRA